MKRDLQGASKWIVYAWCLIMSLTEIYIIIFGLITSTVHINIFLAFVVSLIFLSYKPYKSASDKVHWWDYLLAIVSTVPFYYYVINYDAILTRGSLCNTADIVMMCIAVVCIMEVCRRAIGNALPIISIIFLLYSFFGNHLPGIWAHRGYSLQRLTTILYMTDNGIFGSTSKVAATTVFMFVLFGAFLNHTSAGDTLTKSAFSIAGRSTGGPAKVAVIASGLMGMVSGSAASNVVTTGQLTIPLMKKNGYQPHFAGAVEAAASSGGTLCPPILGAAAFIMVELIATPYSTIVRASILPALLYYLSVFLSVHYEAKRLKLYGLPKEELPALRQVMAEGGHMLLPLVFLIILICLNRPIMNVAFYSTIALIVFSWLRKHTRINFKGILDGLVAGAKSTLDAAAACACAGIVIGVINLTGLGLRFSQLAMELGRNSTFLALLFTMIMLIVLGMGLPAVAAYVIGAAVAGPTLIGMGIPTLAAHLFIFYFSCISSITPPVALAAYLAAGIADANPLRTGFTACRIGLPVFIVPFLFVNNQALLLEGELLVVLQVVATSIIGTFALTLGTIGHFRTKISVPGRVLFFAAGLMMLHPGSWSDIAGIVIVVIGVALNLLREKKEKAAPAAA